MEVVNVEDGNIRAKADKHVNVEEKKQNASDEEVFSPSDGPSDEHEELVRGKRFSEEEEDKIVREAV
jgi:hypothetical protein